MSLAQFVSAIGLFDFYIIFSGIALAVALGMGFLLLSQVIPQLVRRSHPGGSYRPIEWHGDADNASDKQESLILLPWYGRRRDPSHPRYD